MLQRIFESVPSFDSLETDVGIEDFDILREGWLEDSFEFVNTLNFPFSRHELPIGVPLKLWLSPHYVLIYTH